MSILFLESGYDTLRVIIYPDRASVSLLPSPDPASQFKAVYRGHHHDHPWDQHVRLFDPKQPGDHPGGDVHFRGGGQLGGHRGAMQIAQGAEGDDLLHAGVWAGRH